MLRSPALACLLVLGCRAPRSSNPEPSPGEVPAEPAPAPAEAAGIPSDPPASSKPEVAATGPNTSETVEPEAPTAFLDKNEIRTIVRSHIDGVRRCYDAALKVEPALSIRIETRFTIGPSGSVIAVDLRSPEQPTSEVATELEQCLTAEIETWIFPAPPHGGNAVVTYPFIFVPDEGTSTRHDQAGLERGAMRRGSHSWAALPRYPSPWREQQ